MTDTLETVVEATEQSTPADVEAKARRMGWKGPEGYTGPEDKFLDAEAFVKRGEDDPALARANIKALEKALSHANKETAGLKKTMAEFQDYASKAEQRSYDRAMKDLSARQAEYAASGDVQGVRAVTQEIIDLSADIRPPGASETARDGPTEDYVAAVETFKSENTWFDTDRKMTAWAKGLDTELAGDGMEAKARLREIAKQAKLEFPEKFENPARRNGSPVAGGGSIGGRKGGKSFGDLPAEAQQQCARFEKSIKGFSREQYVKNYAWD